MNWLEQLFDAQMTVAAVSYTHLDVYKRQVSLSGSRPSRNAQPTTLSTALCRPMSSRRHLIVPSRVNKPAACTPPVASKSF